QAKIAVRHAGKSGEADTDQPQLLPRTNLARWQQSYPPAGNIARTITDRADRGWEAGSRHLATDLPSRMRCSRAPTHSPGDGGWRLRTLTRKREYSSLLWSSVLYLGRMGSLSTLSRKQPGSVR